MLLLTRQTSDAKWMLKLDACVAIKSRGKKMLQLSPQSPNAHEDADVTTQQMFTISSTNFSNLPSQVYVRLSTPTPI